MQQCENITAVKDLAPTDRTEHMPLYHLAGPQCGTSNYVTDSGEKWLRKSVNHL